MTDRPRYEVVVVGGGPAGTTAAIYTTRLGHRTAVFEKPGGRHAAVANVHNLYGVSEDVSGRDLSLHAVEQFREYGGDYYRDAVQAVRRVDGEGSADDGDGADDRGAGSDGDPPRFVVEAGHATVAADRVVFATGFTDVDHSTPELDRFVGRGLHYCLHCDAYALGDAPAFVLGHGDAAAHVAMVLLNFTADVDLLLDGADPEWSEDVGRRLDAHPVDLVEAPVVDAYPREDGAGVTDEPWLGGLSFADGTDREYLGGFAMYGREYRTDLAAALGCELADDGALAVDDDGQTSVAGVYAAGDVTHGHNQTAVALGDGARVGMAVHGDLRPFPRPADEDDREVPVPAADPHLRARMRLVRDREVHAGLRGPAPDR